MRRITAIFLLATFLVSSSAVLAQKQQSADPIKNPKQAYEGWKLVWADEFNGKKLDTDSWERCPRNTADWGRHMSYLDTLVKVEDGVLKLYGINRPAEVEDNVPYLTGGVQSRNRRSLQLGRVDVRARFDCGQGFWPAIWLMPDIRVPWATGGEIDIMEHLNSEDKAYQTVHSQHSVKQYDPWIENGSNTPIDRNVFNTYSVVIEEDAIKFFINGKPTFTYKKVPELLSQFPYAGHPFYVILSAQLGGSWVGKVNPADLPVKMEIDYVRFYLPKK
jgi:beta-glucanase (GH16 family)